MDSIRGTQGETSVTNAADKKEAELGSKAFAGAALMVATRFAVRLLGLISVTILARLLTPDDFGLFGTAALVLSFFILLKEIGIGEALIKEKEITKEDIDTLWTMRLILSSLTGLAAYIAAPYIAEFLKDPRIIPVLQVMALLPFIDALGSPASPLLLRELRYGADFLLKSGNKFIKVAVVIGVAVALRSYWALVIGALTSSVIGVIITHFVRPYVPRLSLSRLKHHFSFAAWSYLRGISVYIANASDEFVVRSSASTAFFGIYHISRDLGRALIVDLIAPIREAMLPALSKMRDDPARLADATANIFGASLIVGIALSFGIAVTAPELVLILLGDQWQAAAPFLSLLAVGSACHSISEVNQSSFVSGGLADRAAQFWAARAVIYSGGCILFGVLYGPEAIAFSFTLLSIAMLVIETRYLFSRLGVTSGFLSLVARPLVAGLVMVAAIYWLPLPAAMPVLLTLSAKVAVGVATYGFVLLGLWKLSGYRDGPENTLISNLPQKIRRFVPIQLD